MSVCQSGEAASRGDLVRRCVAAGGVGILVDVMRWHGNRQRSPCWGIIWVRPIQQRHFVLVVYYNWFGVHPFCGLIKFFRRILCADKNRHDIWIFPLKRRPQLLHISRLLPLAQCPVCQCGNGRPFNECMQFLTAVDDTLYILTMSISRVMSGQPTFLGHFLVRGNEEWWVFLTCTCDRLVRNWLLFVQHNKNNLINIINRC